MSKRKSRKTTPQGQEQEKVQGQEQAQGSPPENQKRTKRQKKKARLELLLNRLDIKIMGEYFWCMRYENKRPLGTCLHCKAKGCQYKKTMRHFWATHYKKKFPRLDTPIEPVTVAKHRLRFTKKSPRLEYSEKKGKWFKWYYDAHGRVVVDDASAMNIPPPTSGRGPKRERRRKVDDGKVDLEPAHIVLRD